MTTVRQITFLSDFGRSDVFVGLCHAVIAEIAPAARVADLTHDVPLHDVMAGALALADCVPYVHRAVHLAVVDPGVGTRRDGLVVTAGDALLVGPDNGLLLPAARRLGGPTAAYRLSAPRYRAARVSPTFHGRDVFAPAAAHLATGVPPEAFGAAVDVDGLVDLGLPSAAIGERAIAAPVRGIDRFGNVQLAATVVDLERAGLQDAAILRLAVASGTFGITRATTFAELDRGALGLIEDSMGWLAVVMDRDAAARHLGVGPRDTVELTAQR